MKNKDDPVFTKKSNLMLEVGMMEVNLIAKKSTSSTHHFEEYSNQFVKIFDYNSEYIKPRPHLQQVWTGF